MVCSGVQRKKFERAKDDLQRIHEDSKIRATYPRRSRRLSVAVCHTESLEHAFKHRAELYQLHQQKLGSNGARFDKGRT